MPDPKSVSECIERLYDLFAKYVRPPDIDYCTFCYDPDQIDALRETPLRELDSELARLLTWEASDHFGSTDVYKHYLPRILEYLAPPSSGDDIFPEHLFETLGAHEFGTWPEAERETVRSYVAAMTAFIETRDATLAREWRGGAATIGLA